MSYEYQEKGIEWLQEVGRGILADDPGLGKTRQMLLAAQEPVLIVCPAMLQGNWVDEITKWRPDLNYTMVPYSSLCAREENDAGRKALVRPWPRSQYLTPAVPWGTLIADEAHYLKGRQVNWTKAALMLAKSIPRVYLATGTPVPNWAHEIYMLLLLIRPTDRALTNYRKWLLKYFHTWKPHWGGLKIEGLQRNWTWERFAEANQLSSCMLRRTREQVLPELPPLTEITIRSPMTAPQDKLYRKLKKDYLAWTETGQEVVAWSSGGLHTKLHQLTTAPCLIDPGASEGNKVEVLKQLLLDRPHQPIVIFCTYRATARLMTNTAILLGRAVETVTGEHTLPARMNAIRNFQAGVADTLVGTLGTLSEGLNLQRADTCIFVEHSWRPTTNEQAMRRIHRIGQTRPVSVIHLVTKKSVDENMQRLLTKKTDQQMKMLSAADFAQLL